jgi:glycine C-acetyltransferase
VVNAIQNGFKERGFNIGTTQSPVTPVILTGGVGEAAALAYDLRENFAIFCSAVIYPVVPKDVIMLRLIPTSAHTLEDVEETIKAFEAVKHKLESGVYKKGELAAAFQ